jgi:hypothetical protein
MRTHTPLLARSCPPATADVQLVLLRPQGASERLARLDASRTHHDAWCIEPTHDASYAAGRSLMHRHGALMRCAMLTRGWGAGMAQRCNFTVGGPAYIHPADAALAARPSLVNINFGASLRRRYVAWFIHNWIVRRWQEEASGTPETFSNSSGQSV